MHLEKIGPKTDRQGESVSDYQEYIHIIRVMAQNDN
jgi:hypothetical protein